MVAAGIGRFGDGRNECGRQRLGDREADPTVPRVTDLRRPRELCLAFFKVHFYTAFRPQQDRSLSVRVGKNES